MRWCLLAPFPFPHCRMALAHPDFSFPSPVQSLMETLGSPARPQHWSPLVGGHPHGPFCPPPTSLAPNPATKTPPSKGWKQVHRTHDVAAANSADNLGPRTERAAGGGCKPPKWLSLAPPGFLRQPAAP